MKISSPLFVLLLAVTGSLQAGPAVSANYGITICTIDSGGTRVSSAAYGSGSSIGLISGMSLAAAPSETAKIGYIGQWYEATALQLSATPPSVNEGATCQLSAVELMDDLSTVAVNPNSISWSVQSGPVTGITGSGVATAGTVYQDTVASVQGSYVGLLGSLNLTVLNVNNDDLPGYSGDGIDDAWQMQYFGSNNPNAAPNVCSDGSGLTNLFKFTAGLTPHDTTSRFILNVQPVSGMPAQRGITFSPSLTDRHYTVEYSSDLIHWNILSGPFAGTGTSSTVTDAAAGDAPSFYRVRISKP